MRNLHLRRRAGFTLIEVLVVIVLIVVLASLLLVGVMAVLRKGPEVQNRQDMLNLNTALQKFKADYNFYPPSKVILRSNRSTYGTTPLEIESIYYINAMFPSINWTNMNWDGAGMTGEPYTLEGDQCLVFFLGGIPNPSGGVQGFSTDPKDPTSAGGDRKKSMDFDVKRLAFTARTGGDKFPSFMDSHAPNLPQNMRKPFVYFSAGRGTSGYPNNNALFTVNPYSKETGTVTKYHNPDSFQIISAGPDGMFGPGGLWTAGIPTQGAGKDDTSNFHDKALGSP